MTFPTLSLSSLLSYAHSLFVAPLLANSIRIDKMGGSEGMGLPSQMSDGAIETIKEYILLFFGFFGFFLLPVGFPRIRAPCAY